MFGLTSPSHTTSGVGTFSATHASLVRSSGALEHLLLAWIRKQEAEHERLKGDFPRTLGAWVRNYPSGMISDATLELGEARSGVRKVKVMKAQRTVRSYSRDLLASCGDWSGEWSAWGRVVREGVVLSDAHRRRLGLKSNTLPFGTKATPENRKKQSTGSVDGGWNEFEDSGFVDEGLGEKLRFDLSERAKAVCLSFSLQVIHADCLTGNANETPHLDMDRLCLTRRRLRPLNNRPRRFPIPQSTPSQGRYLTLARGTACPTRTARQSRHGTALV